jgi:hypothetical protein
MVPLKEVIKLTILNPTNPLEIERARASVDQIDLSKVHLNLTDEEDGPGWSVEKCRGVELRYRTFLVGHLLYPEISFAPDKDVDVFWHYHILDTRAYITDCDKLFGGYFHHNPYLGMEGVESTEALMQAWELTQALYESVGSGVFAEAAFCGMGKPAFCGM